jgi:hypothetical protein
MTGGADTPALECPEAQELVRWLDAQAAALPRLVAGVPTAALDHRPSSGAWSAREHLAHLGRYHEVFVERLARMRREDVPRFARYRAEEDPGWTAWRDLPADLVLTRLRVLRAEFTAHVGGLTSAELAREGEHPAFGRLPVVLWIEFFLVHEAHHLYVLFQRARESAPRQD